MSTKRQVDANRKNAEMSTGPKTVEGKAISRGNALKHGLSGEGIVDVPENALKLEQRLEEWRPSFRKQLEGANAAREFLFKQVVLNSIRMETAQDRECQIHHSQKQRAIHNWDRDRGLAAEALGLTITKAPGLVVAKLECFLQGCEWLIAQWNLLRNIIQSGRLLEKTQVSFFDDLLGIAHHFRDDSGIESDVALSIADDTIERLEGRCLESLRMLDLQDRIAAENGFIREISKEERLNRRYEDLVTKRFNAAREELMKSRPEPVASAPEPKPEVAIPSLEPTEADLELSEAEMEVVIENKLRAMGLMGNRPSRNEPVATLGKTRKDFLNEALGRGRESMPNASAQG